MAHANTVHGHYINYRRTRTYRSWEAMLGRCRNPKDLAYHNYGGRGITVCVTWFSFQNFLIDMGECPEGLVLDRIDNNKGYYKENCRWATRKQSGQNTRNTILNTEKVKAIKEALSEGKETQVAIAKRFGVSPQTVHHIKSGKQWSNV